MAIDVVTALGGERESEILTALAAEPRIQVVRRCVDLPDLLATAAVGTARLALVSAGLRRLDRDALARLRECGLTVLGVAGALEGEEARLRQLGIDAVVSLAAPAATLAAAVVAAAAPVAVGAGQRSGGAGLGLANPAAALDQIAPPATLDEDESPAPPGGGRVVAVWGPTGAPGRTMLAVTLATELAALDQHTVLVDADTYGGSVAQALGVLEEAPGLAAACRLAGSGLLDLPRLAGVARALSPRLRLLTGISRPERWPEIGAPALEAVLDATRRLAAWTLVDCGFSLEQDEEISYDTLAPRRNGASLTALATADVVIAVGTADPVGLGRLIRGLGDLGQVRPDARPWVVVNRLRRGPIHGDAARSVREAVLRYAGVEPVALVPLDQAAADAALAEGRTLTEAAPDSPARRAVAELAASLAGVAAPGGRRLRRRRLTGRDAQDGR